MTAPPQELLLGRIAVQNKLITMDQLVDATMQQGREPGKRLGNIFVEQGWITNEQLQQLIKTQRELQARMKPSVPAAATPALATTQAPAIPVAPAPAATQAPAVPVAPAPAASSPPAGTPAAAPRSAAAVKAVPAAPAMPAPAPTAPATVAPAAVASIPLASAPVEDGAQAAILTEDAQVAPGTASVYGATAVAVEEPPPATPAAVPAPPTQAPAAPSVAAPAPVTPAPVTPAPQAVAPAPAPVTVHSSPTTLSATQGQGSKELNALLAKGVQAGASDIHIHSGSPIKMRVHGNLLDVSPSPLDKTTAESLLLSSLTPEQQQEFQQTGELDFSYTLASIGRFRANIYRQLRGVDATFRAIPPSPPSLQELGLPTALAKLTNFHQGMVLITGPTGCGKSTTLASLLNIINEERQEHIITIEDPIEHLHPSKRCLVNQRQVGKNTETFARALRAALREDPDIIASGELRDLETISLAITAAETGHLVLATLHTNNTTRTINRVLGVFPPDQQSQIRVMVSESLRAVISQRLLPTADGKKRVAALEILVINRAVSNLIREDKTFQIRSVLQTGSAQGMCLMDSSLLALVKSGTISKEEALKNCEDPKQFNS